MWDTDRLNIELHTFQEMLSILLGCVGSHLSDLKISSSFLGVRYACYREMEIPKNGTHMRLGHEASHRWDRCQLLPCPGSNMSHCCVGKGW